MHCTHPRGETGTSIIPLVRSGEPKRGQNYSTRPVSAAVLRCFVVLRCDLVTVVFGVCGFRLCLCCGCVFCRLLLLFVVVCCFFCCLCLFLQFLPPNVTIVPNIDTHFAVCRVPFF